MTPKPTGSNITTPQQVHLDINSFLATFFDQQLKQAQEIDKDYTCLWQALLEVTLGGGKRFRPYLLILCYQAYGGKDYEDVLTVAAAQELLHASLLMHDDIIDKDYRRHGQPNVAGIFKERYQQLPRSHEAEHYANGAALLGGDLLVAAAYDLIATANLDIPYKLAALGELSQNIFTVYGGEMLDMESVLKPFKEVDTLRIAELKTAYYSCIAPAKTGALLADAAKSEFKELEVFATALGVAYQLVDDLLGVFGEEAMTGKSSMSDIREAKRTFVMAEAVATASKSERKVLDKYLGKPNLTKAEADQVRAVLISSGAKQATIDTVRTYAKKAQTSLERLDINSQSKLALEQLIQRAIDRVS